MTDTGPRPLRTAAQAVEVAHSLVGTGVYWLGTGDMDTPRGGRSDCFGFAYNRCYGVRRHRPGFNRGWQADARYPGGASIVDDLNVNSAIEDADHHQELFERVATPFPGALLAYPSFYLAGHPKPWIGHICIVVGVSRCLEWGADHPDWSLLDVVQCSGPDGHTPGILPSNGEHWNDHDRNWPKPEHRSVLLRALS